jgi:hypothetical protein
MPARVRKVSGWWRRGSHGECQVLDYNRLGAALVSSRALPIGSRLLLDLNAGHFVLRRLPAQVVSCVRDGRQYRVGVQFFRHLDVPESEGKGSLTVLSGLEDSLIVEPLTS